MLPVVGWRVYCSDGSTYTSGQVDPSTIPATVQAVVYFHAHPYRTIGSGTDTYEVDGVTLFGAWMDEAGLEVILQTAFEDMAWPSTS
jgi:hypothetical protein